MVVEIQQRHASNDTVSIDIPLIVDLDGTLIAADLLAETIVGHVAGKPSSIFNLTGLLRRGKAGLKDFLAAQQEIDVAKLPYREVVIDVIEEARAAGRPVYLATASHERYATAIARHLLLFNGVFATSPVNNLAGSKKAEALVDRFGEGCFDYIGNSTDDLEVWRHARRCYTVAVSGSVSRRLDAMNKEVIPLLTVRPNLRVWMRALRVHQYAKNTLIFLPLVARHTLQGDVVANALLAFVSFSLAASAIYLVNDMIDISDDRGHPTKKKRPLASGLISIHQAVLAVPVLLIASALLATTLSPLFAVVLMGYMCLTTAYSFWLKRKMLIDVIVLALLYTTRVYAGSAATAIPPSDWLLAFCLFAFTALALMKRYTELLMRIDNQLPDATNRNYRKDDLPVIASLAAAAGVNMVMVFALYTQSSEVALMYRHPHVLWLLCPLLLYLISRALLMAHRRLMHEDPVVWALKDRVCRIGIVVAGAIISAAAFL